MATNCIARLDKLVSDSDGDWRVFIRKLGSLHARWHSELNNETAALGFLSGART